MPYLLIGLLGGFAVLFLWQTRHEVSRVEGYLGNLEAKQALAEEKANFYLITAHYLRTPVSIIKAGIEGLPSARVSPQARSGLTEATDSILVNIERLVHRLSGPTKQQTTAPNLELAALKAFASPYFLVPVVLVIGLGIAANVFFGNLGTIKGSMVSYATQGVAFLVVAELFYIYFRRRYIKRQQRRDLERRLQHQQALQRERNRFIEHANQLLVHDMAQLKSKSVGLPKSKATTILSGGIGDLQRIVDRMGMVPALSSEKPSTDHLSLDSLVTGVARRYTKTLRQKKLRLDWALERVRLTQDKQKLSFVVETLIDNAIKYARPGSVIRIELRKVLSGVRLAVHNSGPGIKKKYVEHMFKPFSKAGSAWDFNNPGFGLSLFLDKIIMRTLGGSISLTSTSRRDTGVMITVPDASG